MLFYSLICALIPFLLWTIQKYNNKLSAKSNYLRRRIFAYQMAILMLIEVVGLISILSNKELAAEWIPALVRSSGWWLGWVIFLYFGFSKKDFKENRGYIYSIWEPYDPEYVNFSNGWIKAIKNWQGLGGKTSSKE